MTAVYQNGGMMSDINQLKQAADEAAANYAAESMSPKKTTFSVQLARMKASLAATRYRRALIKENGK